MIFLILNQILFYFYFFSNYIYNFLKIFLYDNINNKNYLLYIITL